MPPRASQGAHGYLALPVEVPFECPHWSVRPPSLSSFCQLSKFMVLSVFLTLSIQFFVMFIDKVMGFMKVTLDTDGLVVYSGHVVH